MELFSFLFNNPHILSIFLFLSGMGIKLLIPSIHVGKKFSDIITFYLILAIGIKGGLSFSHHISSNYNVFSLIFWSVLLGLLQPFLSYYLLRRFTQIEQVNAAVISAQYGSVSLITFATAIAYLKKQNIDFEGSIFSVMAIMELPAIFSGLFISLRSTSISISIKELFQHIFFNKVILTLLSAFLIGYLMQKWDFRSEASFILTPFSWILNLFLIYMGIVIASQKEKLKQLNFRLCLFGIYMPLIGGLIAMTFAFFLHLDIGTSILFTVLGASASYIAVPAVMKLALPNANEAIYFPLAIGITFPFNITIGIPLYYQLNRLMFI